jgi:hypothetical protein
MLPIILSFLDSKVTAEDSSSEQRQQEAEMTTFAP